MRNFKHTIREGHKTRKLSVLLFVQISRNMKWYWRELRLQEAARHLSTRQREIIGPRTEAAVELVRGRLVKVILRADDLHEFRFASRSNPDSCFAASA